MSKKHNSARFGMGVVETAAPDFKDIRLKFEYIRTLKIKLRNYMGLAAELYDSGQDNHESFTETMNVIRKLQKEIESLEKRAS